MCKFATTMSTFRSSSCAGGESTHHLEVRTSLVSSRNCGSFPWLSSIFFLCLLSKHCFHSSWNLNISIDRYWTAPSWKSSWVRGEEGTWWILIFSDAMMKSFTNHKHGYRRFFCIFVFVFSRQLHWIERKVHNFVWFALLYKCGWVQDVYYKLSSLLETSDSETAHKYGNFFFFRCYTTIEYRYSIH